MILKLVQIKVFQDLFPLHDEAEQEEGHLIRFGLAHTEISTISANGEIAGKI
jgi:hypothetical protein